MQATKYREEQANTSHWLDIVESFAVLAAIGGSIAAAVSQQIVMASIPLSLTATLNLANRRRQMNAMQGRQRQEITHLIQHSQDDFQADISNAKQIGKAVQSQIEQLSQQSRQSVQTISTLTSKMEQLTSEITILKASQAQEQASLREHSQNSKSQYDDLSTQVTDLYSEISFIQSSTLDLMSQVEAQQSHSQNLASQTENVEELLEILREIDAITQTISAQPDIADNFYQRGLIRKRLQRLEDQSIALDDFSKAIHLEPTHGEAYFERGLLHSESGQKQLAVDDLRTAAKLYFEDGQLDKYEQARTLSQNIHDLMAVASSPHEETEQYLIENLFS